MPEPPNQCKLASKHTLAPHIRASEESAARCSHGTQTNQTNLIANVKPIHSPGQQMVATQ